MSETYFTPENSIETEESVESTIIPDDPFARANYHYYEEEDFENAICEFNRALEVEDQNLETIRRAMYWKGESLAKLGRYDEAIQTFEELASHHKKSSLGYSAKQRIQHLKEVKEEMFG